MRPLMQKPPDPMPSEILIHPVSFTFDHFTDKNQKLLFKGFFAYSIFFETSEILLPGMHSLMARYIAFWVTSHWVKLLTKKKYQIFDFGIYVTEGDHYRRITEVAIEVTSGVEIGPISILKNSVIRHSMAQNWNC